MRNVTWRSTGTTSMRRSANCSPATASSITSSSIFLTGPQRHPEIWGGKGRDDWGSEELLQMTRELQPGIVVNDRLGLPAAT